MKSLTKTLFVVTWSLSCACFSISTFAQVYQDPAPSGQPRQTDQDNNWDKDDNRNYNPSEDQQRQEQSPVQYARFIKHSLAQKYVGAGLRSGTSVFFVSMAPALIVAPLLQGSDRYCNSDSGYGQILGYTRPGIAIYLCDAYLDTDEELAAQILIHELAHYVGVLFECSADNISRKAVVAAGQKFIPTGYTEACESGHEPFIDRIFSATGVRP